jgi:hypothetical protein
VHRKACGAGSEKLRRLLKTDKVAAAMAAKMRGRPYEGDAHQEIRNAGFWGFWKLGREIVAWSAKFPPAQAMRALLGRKWLRFLGRQRVAGS